MKVTTGALVFILLLIAIAVLGHSVWHSQVLAVMNALSVFFTGVT
jgi:hypothetical protein